ncbi:hypothetical protein Ptr902_04239 [Pyrenophora tritici-repentis]|nr:hypothetical protein Ptr902_04239 [Pyrenophora tritici-repentis]
MSENNDMPPAIVFGILSLIVALLGLHYRDSLCCLCFRSLMEAWFLSMNIQSAAHMVICWPFEGPELDIEAMAGMQHGLRSDLRSEKDDSIELQPRSSIPLYFDSASVGRADLHTSTNDHENTIPMTPMDV